METIILPARRHLFLEWVHVIGLGVFLLLIYLCHQVSLGKSSEMDMWYVTGRKQTAGY